MSHTTILPSVPFVLKTGYLKEPTAQKSTQATISDIAAHFGKLFAIYAVEITPTLLSFDDWPQRQQQDAVISYVSMALPDGVLRPDSAQGGIAIMALQKTVAFRCKPAPSTLR
jgi:hypothetical protein